MELFHQAIDLFLHLDKHLDQFLTDHGMWTYPLLFAIIFCETGLVVTPFLPGDSLLFAAGALSARGTGLSPWLVAAVLISAAFLGDTANYWIGRKLAPRVARGGRIKFIKQKHLDKTNAFFARHGGKTVIIARFVPIVRTFTPFVAGVGAMPYSRFIGYSLVGSLIWGGVCIGAGYLFGNIEIVKQNFSLVVLGIIAVSLLPIAIEWWRSRRAAASGVTA